MSKHTDPLDTTSKRVSRREALRHVSALLGGAALVGGSGLLASCARYGQPQDPAAAEAAFADAEVALLDEVAETLLPETSTPGAKAAEVGAFMAFMVADAYSPTDQNVFREGMVALEAVSRDEHGGDFLAITPEQRLALLERLDREQMDYMHSKDGDAPAHWFRMMKELALLGYFTSEIGYTQAMRYVERPGRYDPCAPYEEGERAWAPHA